MARSDSMAVAAAFGPPAGLAPALAALFLAAAFLFHATVPLQQDVSFFIVSCGRLLDGGRAYVDILETNPPLAFWVTLPPVALARALDVPPQPVFVAWVCAGIAASLLLARRVSLAAGEERAAADRLTIAAAAALCLVPNEAFGQREHFAALLLLPYLAAAGLRATGLVPPAAWRALAGIAAGAGVCFKPYFLAMPLAAELYLLWLTRDARALLRAEVLAAALPVLAFPLLVWRFTPEYFTRIVPLAMETYAAYGQPLWRVALCPQLAVTLPMLALTAALAWRNGDRRGGLWIAAAAGAYLGYLAQSKGWRYQLLPTAAFTFIAFFEAAVFSARRAHRLAAVAFVAVYAVTLNAAFVVREQTKLAWLDATFAGLPPGRLMVLSHDNGVLFPFVLRRDMEWGSSFPALWMLPAVSKDLVPPERRAAVVAAAADIVVADLARYAPDYVMVDRRSDTAILAGRDVGYLELLGGSPAFVRLWQGFALSGRSADFELWRRKP